MEVTEQEIEHLTSLSNFSLGSEEKTKLKSDLENILRYIGKLDELDVDGVEPTYQVFEMKNVWRPDEIREQDATREELLNLSKEAEDHQIKVPKVL
ncbi:Asp-tRNA(Asn)/Glu-tRNA(Gln) amidotransferase subunit GatC [Candidatus Saccharibacteria bacterium]|nr:Asp-tRNA(Asn)/Glu-tRNA(Gln) amidotransferase subunit GatC [Candidatus Saccharibacteria bacterium]